MLLNRAGRARPDGRTEARCQPANSRHNSTSNPRALSRGQYNQPASRGQYAAEARGHSVVVACEGFEAVPAIAAVASRPSIPGI